MSIKKEDIEFLKSLQEELLTQDKDYQASPRFWVVMQTVKDYWVEDDIQGVCIYSSGAGEEIFEGEFEELPQWLNILDGVENCIYQNGYIEFTINNEEETLFDTSDVSDFLDKYEIDEYTVCNYRLRDEIVKDTMFLTKRECKEHIEANRHHYNNTAHPYAMTAWRSPQVKRLYEILENTNWEDN